MFHEGDEVTVREREFLETQEDVWPSCVPKMWELAGMTFRVKKSESGCTYLLDGRASQFWWLEDWLVPADEKIQEITSEAFETFEALL